MNGYRALRPEGFVFYTSSSDSDLQVSAISMSVAVNQRLQIDNPIFSFFFRFLFTVDTFCLLLFCPEFRYIWPYEQMNALRHVSCLSPLRHEVLVYTTSKIVS